MIILPGPYNLSETPYYWLKDMVKGLCNIHYSDVTEERWSHTWIYGIHGVNNPGRRAVCRRCLSALWCGLSPTGRGKPQHTLVKNEPLIVLTMLYRQGSSPKPLWPLSVKLTWNHSEFGGRGRLDVLACHHGSLNGGTETRCRKVIRKR